MEDRIAKKGQYEEQHITSSLFVTTRKVLSGVKEQERWTDADRHRHWVLLVIDRNRADEQLAKQNLADDVAYRLENRQQEVLDGIKAITGMLDRNMALYAEQMAHYGELLQKIDTKVGAASTATRQEYDAIRQAIATMEARQRLHNDTMARYSDQQNQQMAELIRQNNELRQQILKVTGKIQKDYFLALADDDLKNGSGDAGFGVTIDPDKGQGATYYRGEKIRFRVRATRDCYIKVIYLSSTNGNSGSPRRMNILLFPNVHDRNNRLRTGETKVIGQYGELEVEPPFGQDVVTVVASQKQFTDLDETLKSADGRYYSEMTANTRSALQVRTRGIGLVAAASDRPPAGAAAPGKAAAISTDTCFIVSENR
jgi:hypothetical protein